jgi:hypothetical protein
MLKPQDQAEGLRRILMPEKPSAMTIVEFNLQQSKGQFLQNLIPEFKNLGIKFVDTSLAGHQEHSLALLNHPEIALKLKHSANSIKQAFHIIKLLSKSSENRVFGMIVCAQDQITAQTVFRNIKQASKQFLHIQLELIGFSTLDSNWVSPVTFNSVPTQKNDTKTTTLFA